MDGSDIEALSRMSSGELDIGQIFVAIVVFNVVVVVVFDVN